MHQNSPKITLKAKNFPGGETFGPVFRFRPRLHSIWCSAFASVRQIFNQVSAYGLATLYVQCSPARELNNVTQISPLKGDIYKVSQSMPYRVQQTATMKQSTDQRFVGHVMML